MNELKGPGIKEAEVLDRKHTQEERRGIRRVIFYGISLLLSFVIVVVSTTVFVVAILLEGGVTRDFFILFISIIAINLGISAVSLRGLMLSYPDLSRSSEKPRVFLMQNHENRNRDDPAERHLNLDKRYFTEIEVEIVDLLEKNGNKMLQSTLVSSIGASKATISRALSSLENKGIVVKLRKGVTNEIILSETYS